MIRSKTSNAIDAKATAKAAVAHQQVVLAELRQRYTPEVISKLHRLHWELIQVLSDKAAQLDDDEAYFLIQRGITSLLELDAVMAEV